MNRIFSTDDVHPRDRFDYWHDVACAHIVVHDSQAENRGAFSARIDTGSIAGIDVVHFRNAPMTVEHKLGHISRTRDDEIFLCRLMAGELRIEQDARDCLLTPGSSTLIDPRLSYTGVFTGESELLVYKLPRDLLAARLGGTRELLAHALHPAEGDTALLSSYLSMLPNHVGEISSAAAGQVGGQLLDLVALVLSNKLEMRPRASSSRALVRLNVRAAIEADLNDPDLNAEAVCKRVGVSVRYANDVLADESTSVCRLILERRLARCRAALADPGQARRLIAEIAFGWGFSDMTHFGRRFKQAYGLSPKDYRKACRVPTRE
jgi:AraC family transcriptional regulator, positive regulator of tynA and feaB